MTGTTVLSDGSRVTMDLNGKPGGEAEPPVLEEDMPDVYDAYWQARPGLSDMAATAPQAQTDQRSSGR